MNFIEAMTLCYDNPPGPGAVMVGRPGRATFIYLGGTDFYGKPCYLTWTDNEDGDLEGNAYTPTRDDIQAEDWYILRKTI